MAINRANYQAELVARKSKSLHLNLQTPLLHPGKVPAMPCESVARSGYIIALRILAAIVVLTGIYFLFL